MGCGENASKLFFDSFSPWCSRTVFNVICGLPLELQKGGEVLDRLAAHFAPSLADIPYASGTAAWRRQLPQSVRFLGKLLYATLR